MGLSICYELQLPGVTNESEVDEGLVRDLIAAAAEVREAPLRLRRPI